MAEHLNEDGNSEDADQLPKGYGQNTPPQVTPVPQTYFEASVAETTRRAYSPGMRSDERTTMLLVRSIHTLELENGQLKSLNSDLLDQSSLKAETISDLRVKLAEKEGEINALKISKAIQSQQLEAESRLSKGLLLAAGFFIPMGISLFKDETKASIAIIVAGIAMAFFGIFPRILKKEKKDDSK